ncbi:PREDICTED: mannosyl-oligosaccharide alpha-1,2-mannosidase IA-like, partial [Rhagoletis zephyria]|uniref:mannosyl-oligosaccharide alpha-1,2-mannosidase IA-like n=1 Tax=Rhagoletis zephyria TaxID=28612 RepID=UPI000811A3F5
MTASAFAHYRKYAWGKPALAPLSRKSTHTNMTGPLPGQTIVYAMSTFWVMDLKEEWAAGREWIANHLRLDDVNAQLDVHYTISFYIGSLLSAYALSGDQVLLIKAIEVFNALPKNGLFDLGSGLTPQKFNPKTNTYEHTANYISFQVPELIYLFNLTRNQEIGDWLAKGRAELRKRSGVHTFEKKTGFWEPAKYAWREISGHFDDMLSSYNQLGQWDTE